MPPDPTSIATVDLSRSWPTGRRSGEVNPQRFEMEQLDAIVLIDPEQARHRRLQGRAADEFWVRGHMPGLPAVAGRADVRGGGPAGCRTTSSRSGLMAGRLHRLRRHGERPLPRLGPAGRPAGAGRQGDAAQPPADRSSTSRASSARRWSSTRDIIGVPIDRGRARRRAEPCAKPRPPAARGAGPPYLLDAARRPESGRRPPPEPSTGAALRQRPPRRDRGRLRQGAVPGHRRPGRTRRRISSASRSSASTQLYTPTRHRQARR